MQHGKVAAWLLVALMTGTALAQSGNGNVIFNDNKKHQTVTLEHAALFALNGRDEVLTVNGDCAKVFLRGRSNVVTFNGNVGEVTLAGTLNKIVFDGTLDSLEVSGNADEITTRKAPQGKALTLSVSGDGAIVRWSHAGHPTAPELRDLGTGTKLVPIP